MGGGDSLGETRALWPLLAATTTPLPAVPLLLCFQGTRSSDATGPDRPTTTIRPLATWQLTQPQSHSLEPNFPPSANHSHFSSRKSKGKTSPRDATRPTDNTSTRHTGEHHKWSEPHEPPASLWRILCLHPPRQRRRQPPTRNESAIRRATLHPSRTINTSHSTLRPTRRRACYQRRPSSQKGREIRMGSHC